MARLVTAWERSARQELPQFCEQARQGIPFFERLRRFEDVHTDVFSRRNTASAAGSGGLRLLGPWREPMRHTRIIARRRKNGSRVQMRAYLPESIRRL